MQVYTSIFTTSSIQLLALAATKFIPYGKHHTPAIGRPNAGARVKSWAFGEILLVSYIVHTQSKQ